MTVDLHTRAIEAAARAHYERTMDDSDMFPGPAWGDLPESYRVQWRRDLPPIVDAVLAEVTGPEQLSVAPVEPPPCGIAGAHGHVYRRGEKAAHIEVDARATVHVSEALLHGLLAEAGFAQEADR